MATELRDILRNRVKEKLARDEVVVSMTVRLTRSIEIARIAATAGFDTLYVDVEHNTFSIDSVSQICMAATPRWFACRPTRRNSSAACSTAARSA